MMRGQFFETRENGAPAEAIVPTTVSITSEDELMSLLDRTARARGTTGPAALVLERGDDSSLMLVATPRGHVLAWFDPLGASFHSVGDPAARGFVVFDYFGSYTEVEAKCAIDPGLARNAALEYLRSGVPHTDGLLLEPD